MVSWVCADTIIEIRKREKKLLMTNTRRKRLVIPKYEFEREIGGNEVVMLLCMVCSKVRTKLEFRFIASVAVSSFVRNFWAARHFP